MSPRRPRPAPPLTAEQVIAAQMALEGAQAKRLAARKEADLKAQLRAAEEQMEAAQKVSAFVDEVRENLTTVKLEPWKTRTLGKGKRIAAAMALLSDWHIEERVDASKLNGLNHYNPAIAEFRLRRCFEGIEWLIREQRGMFEIRDLVLVLNGDLMTGYIHEELVETNFMSPTRTVVFGVRIFGAGIQYLLDNTDLNIHAVCKPGNHGRTTKKIHVGTYVENSYEWLLYHMLMEKFADEPRVRWQIDDGMHSLFDVYGLRVHAHHGDSVKSGGGIGGLDVPINRAVLNWSKKYNSNLSIIGHFHEFQMGRKCWRNGSGIGYANYSDFLASAHPEPAQQCFGLIDSKRGVTQCAPLWVGDPSAEKSLVWNEPERGTGHKVRVGT